MNSPFCKVGLVAKNRTTEQRIKEHQTGNPRKIVEQAVIKTNAVNSLETYLHDRLSPHRVAGEWFELDEQQFESVVDEANLIAAQLREIDAALGDAVALKTTPSESAQISPRDVDLEQHRSPWLLNGRFYTGGRAENFGAQAPARNGPPGWHCWHDRCDRSLFTKKVRPKQIKT